MDGGDDEDEFEVPLSSGSSSESSSMHGSVRAGGGGGGGSSRKPASSVAQFGNRVLTDLHDVFSQNAWDKATWTPEQEQQAAAQVAVQMANPLPAQAQADYHEHAPRFWDRFYDQHSNKFFKDRHWLGIEFPELVRVPEDATEFNVLEVGCGVGNTVFPLLTQLPDPRLHVWACDFSSTAIDIVKASANFDAKRCTAFVCDISCEPLAPTVAPGSIDVAAMIFVLSALRPDTFEAALAKIFEALKPGGLLLFRDYGRYDLAQLRFKPRAVLGDNFYVRGDGTRVYFFDEQEARQMVERVGFVVQEHAMDRRLIVNRTRKLQMYRMWLQGKYRKPA